jgi:hypothetical protein
VCKWPERGGEGGGWFVKMWAWLVVWGEVDVWQSQAAYGDAPFMPTAEGSQDSRRSGREKTGQGVLFRLSSRSRSVWKLACILSGNTVTPVE